MEVDPTFTTMEYLRSYGVDLEQFHTVTTASFFSPVGRVDLRCKIAWLAKFSDGQEKNICWSCTLGVPRIAPVWFGLRVFEYYDSLYNHFDDGDHHILILGNKWRAPLTGLVGRIEIEDGRPTETERIELWLQRRLVNAFASL